MTEMFYFWKSLENVSSVLVLFPVLILFNYFSSANDFFLTSQISTERFYRLEINLIQLLKKNKKTHVLFTKTFGINVIIFVLLINIYILITAKQKISHIKFVRINRNY